MRKALAVLIMISVCSIYFIAMKNRDSVTEVKSIDIEETIEGASTVAIDAIIEAIERQYPETPRLLMEMNNQIMEVQYSDDWAVDSEVEKQTLYALRLLFSEELLALNKYEKQFEHLRAELIKNHAESIYLEGSQIESINFLTPDDAFVEVLYKTTKGAQKRQYTLVKEDGLWKIYSWKDFELMNGDSNLEE
ncbi:MAG: DUF6715 family protein [Niameybacter sp.]|uniref:DUF6715 family protein n=2 Tax=Niameybacter sp. TaxID=2033640 RepID=UPI002FC5C248